jgi:aminoglycoside N3'-acetyltransferase
MKSYNFNTLEKILKNLKISKGSKIYLGLDLMRIAASSGSYKKNKEILSNKLLDFFLKKIGKKGALVIPVFFDDCIKEKKFDRRFSPGQSGAFGNLLLKRNYLNRTKHPLVSFLYFGKDEKKIINIDNHNSEGPDSLWAKMLKEKFVILTLGFHYALSTTIVHYLEKEADINYRFNKNFQIKYKDFNKKTKNKTYSFFARKIKSCDYSSMTIQCDKLFFKKKIYTFSKVNKLIGYKLDLAKASEIILKDLKKNSHKLVSYTGKYKKNSNLLIGEQLSMLEKKHYNSI